MQRFRDRYGCSKKDLSKGLLAAASAIADKKHYHSWEELEKVIATEIKKKCNGSATEWFSARQAAADLWFHWFGQKPKMCRLGIGARKGFYLAERANKLHARKHRRAKIPVRTYMREQTGYCEYMKLVKRVNFPNCAKRAAYKPTDT